MGVSLISTVRLSSVRVIRACASMREFTVSLICSLTLDIYARRLIEYMKSFTVADSFLIGTYYFTFSSIKVLKPIRSIRASTVIFSPTRSKFIKKAKKVCKLTKILKRQIII